MTKKPPRLNRIIRKKDLPTYLGLQRSAIDQLVQRGELKLYSLTPKGRTQGAFEDDLIEWQQRRRELADACRR